VNVSANHFGFFFWNPFERQPRRSHFEIIATIAATAALRDRMRIAAQPRIMNHCAAQAALQRFSSNCFLFFHGLSCREARFIVIMNPPCVIVVV